MKCVNFSKNVLLSTLITLTFSTSYSQDLVSSYELVKFPDWSDAFNDLHKPEVLYMRIDKIMKDFEMTRMEAITVQRQYREGIENNPLADRQLLFDTAVRNVRDGKLGRTNKDKILNAKFIVVFDLDETLYDQGLKSDNKCNNISYNFMGKEKKILTVKNIKSIVTKINQLGGEVAIFSANQTKLTEQNVKEWKNEEGLSVFSMPEIVAVLTTKELVQQPKETGYVVTTTSKDLRFFDEKLEKVIIVDDNPNRIFQQRNVRAVKKLDGDEYCSSPGTRRLYDNIIPDVISEIEDSVVYMILNNISFVSAFLPYSLTGRMTVDLIMSTENLTREAAVEKVRQNPNLVDLHF